MSARYGELVIDGEQAVTTFVRHLPYRIEAVWSAIADPDQRAAWFGETAIEGRVGGVIDMVPSEPPAPVAGYRLGPEGGPTVTATTNRSTTMNRRTTCTGSASGSVQAGTAQPVARTI